MRSQELWGRGVRDCCRHGALQRDNVSHRIAEIGPDRLDEVLRATAAVTHNARQAASHCLVDDQSPGFLCITGQNQTVGRNIGSTDFGLVEKADERGVRSRCDLRRLTRSFVSASKHTSQACLSSTAELARPDPQQMYFLSLQSRAEDAVSLQ